MNEAKVLLSIGFILLLGLLQIACNAKKSRRVRQFPLLFISAILMVVGVLVWNKNVQKASDFCALADFLENGEILTMNAALLLGYGVIRLVLRPIITKLVKNNRTLETFSLGFYEYDDEYDEWFLKKQWINFRKYFFTVCVALNCVSGLYLGLTWQLGKTSSIWLMFYPCAAVAVMNEIYNYINGQTKEEFAHSVLGDEADARRISNYYKLREIYEEILPEPLLTAHTGCEFIGTESAASLLEEKQHSKDEKDHITAAFFNTDDRYKTADIDCVQATFQLMHRHNVVFFNPFYRDLGAYVTLPMVTALLSGKKCLILCGRKSCTEDIKGWLKELLKDYSHMSSLWRVEYLSDKEPECEVGILTFAQIYDKRVINSNRTFLSSTDFVLLIEPSVMLNTSQVALSILSEEMETGEEKPTYCVCDRYTDGLVDTLSHLLRTEITDVVAMPLPRCSYTSLSWDADGDFSRQRLFDKQTKYLGNGIELAAIAVKNQIPEVTWYSETKAPIKDIKWIAGQYYSTICRYMNQPSQQKSLYEKIKFSSTLWSASPKKESFIIVEDEFCNMFNMMRAYLSRGKTQAFVNVLSENYLLRDYMRCNRQVFMSDPNAVPSLVPDYAKTERNTILKLLLTMVVRPVSDDEVLQELHLAGIETDDAFGALGKLLRKYTFADSSIFTVRSIRTTVDEFTTISSCVYTITDEAFDKFFSDSLRNAYFILEDEKNEESYIDAKLFNHVTQVILPGQFVTYDGKYYAAKYVSPQSGVVLRRASDLYGGRKYYRQIRRYVLDGEQGDIIWQRKVGDIEFAEIQIDFHVDTSGYLEMADSHNLRTAKVIDFSKDPTVEYYSRKYHNKSVLRIRLPDTDEKIRFTICLLLSEIFKTVFPDGWQYITVSTRQLDDIDGMLNYMLYKLDDAFEDGYIYVIEDSSIDLGLLNAIEKNFTKLMEIAADFLDWHCEKMREPASKDPVPVKISVAEAAEKKKRNLIVRMLDRIRKLFNAGKPSELVEIPSAEKVEAETQKEHTGSSAETPEETAPITSSEYDLDQTAQHEKTEDPELAPVAGNEASEYSLGEENEVQVAPDSETADTTPAPPHDQEETHPEDEFQPTEENDPDLVAIDGTDIFDNEGMPEDNDYLESSFVAMGLTPITKSRYQRECFLKFGFEEIDGRIQVDAVRKYLRVRGWSNNSLTLARKREVLARTKMDLTAVNHCDFCGLPLSGVSYERLNDGRVRCNDCSSSAIAKPDDFRELFCRTLGMMEDFFEIRYRVPIRVKMADARTVAKGAGMIFKPSTGVAPRVLGFAQRKNGKYSLLVENGSPRLATIDTMVHEMTHIWQYLNWDDKQIASIYGMNDASCSGIARDIVYEGMAMWASIQYLYQIGETFYAMQQEALAEMRQDVYGIGFRLYQEQYPLMKDSSLLKYSPFSSFPTLEPSAVKAAVKSRCTRKECKC